MPGTVVAGGGELVVGPRRGADRQRPAGRPLPAGPARHRRHADGEDPPGHEVHAEEPQGQDPDVVEAGQRVDDEPQGRQPAQHGEKEAEAAPQDQRHHHRHPGQAERPQVRPGEQEGGVGGDVGVVHGGRVRLADPEGHQPPPRQQQPQADGERPPPHRGPPAPHPLATRRPGDGRRGAAKVVVEPPALGEELDAVRSTAPDHGEHGRDDVGQDARRQHQPRPSPGGGRCGSRRANRPEEQKGQGDAEGVGVLTGQGGEQVPPVDGQRVVEEERQRGRGQRRRRRRPQPEEAAEGPGGHRQEQRAEHRGQLEGDVVADEVRGQRHQDVGQHEVEGVDGVSVVPRGAPAGEVGEEVGAEVGRHHVVGPGVAPGGGGVGQRAG